MTVTLGCLVGLRTVDMIAAFPNMSERKLKRISAAYSLAARRGDPIETVYTPMTRGAAPFVRRMLTPAHRLFVRLAYIFDPDLTTDRLREHLEEHSGVSLHTRDVCSVEVNSL